MKKQINKRKLELKKFIFEWDILSKDNEDNKHNLSTTQRQNWVDEFIEIEDNENN